jgi:hypothetical protein
MGAVLFERMNGGTRPTVAGLEFVEQARRILEETEMAMRNLRSRSRGENGRLTIGVYGILLMLEGGTGVRQEGVVFREIQEDAAPTTLVFAAYWQQSNRNPTLEPFLRMLQERYPDLSGGLP